MKKIIRQLFFFAAVCVTFLSFGTLQAAAGSTSTVTLTGTCSYSDAYELLDLVNQERESAGLDTLTMDQDLMNAAMQRAAEICINASSTRPSGENFKTVSSKVSEENLASGFSSASDVMYGKDGWMNSKDATYKNRILNEDYQSIGIGCFTHEDTTFWIQLFGTEKARTAAKPADAQKRMSVELDDSTFEKYLTLYSEDGSTLPVETKSTFSVYLTNPGLSKKGVSFQAKLNADSFKWKSNHRKKFTVNESGVVTAIKKGSGTLKAKCLNGKLSVSKTLTIAYNLSTEIKSIENKKSGVTLKWTESPSADGYYVYRRKGSGKYRQIATIEGQSTTKYKDTSVKSKNGTGYTYKVTACKGSQTGEDAEAAIVRLTGAKISEVTASGSGKATVKWKKVTGISGYEIEVSSSRKFTNSKTKTVSSSKTKKVLSRLSSGKNYVRIRTYKRVSGVDYYSAWSAVKSVKVK